ncbi:hypothetical protein EON83_30070 [bacterium]|nr:MAG: hypothetical protein EON83_30070 [bacterium]
MRSRRANSRCAINCRHHIIILSGSTSAPPRTSISLHSRVGKRAITLYVSPELWETMRITTVRHKLSMKAAGTEALNDWLRKMGDGKKIPIILRWFHEVNGAPFW